VGVAGTLALGILSGSFFLSEAIAAPGPVEAPESASATVAAGVGRNVINDNGLFCLALAIYFEGGSTGETEEGQRHIARVVAARARADRRKWGGSDLCDVVFYNRRGVCQFTFACLPLARRTPNGGAAWQRSLAIAQDELEGRSPVHARFISYYMNPALTSDRNACRFRKEFVPVLEAGRHHFFREPVERERAKLASGEYPECKRLTQPRPKKSSKRIAKSGAKKKMTKRLATNP
jgi:spore germination cell wall hydrolase CwlJ-like protein